VGGEVDPHPVADDHGVHALSHGVHHPRTVLVGGDLRKGQAAAGAGSSTRLPVGRVDPGHDDPDPDLAGCRVHEGAIDELQD
jgi:hypothetical protein